MKKILWLLLALVVLLCSSVMATNTTVADYGIVEYNQFGSDSNTTLWANIRPTSCQYILDDTGIDSWYIDCHPVSVMLIWNYGSAYSQVVNYGTIQKPYYNADGAPLNVFSTADTWAAIWGPQSKLDLIWAFNYAGGTGAGYKYYASYVPHTAYIEMDTGWYMQLSYLPGSTGIYTAYSNISINSSQDGIYTLKVITTDTIDPAIQKVTLLGYTISNGQSVYGGNVTIIPGQNKPGTDTISILLGKYKAIWWIVIMAIIGIAIVAVAGMKNIKISSIIAAFIELVMLVIGAYLGIISSLILLLLGMLLAAYIAVFIKKAFS